MKDNMKLRVIMIGLVLLLNAGLPLWTGAADFSLSTNAIALADYGTLNLEGSLALARKWTLNAAVNFNPFKYGSGQEENFHKQQSYSIGARFWPWHIYSGWWIAGKGRYQEYSRCERSSTLTNEGDRFGAGLSAGYGKMLGTHFNLDFGLGFWAGYDKYTSYACQHCGRVVDKGSGFFILPADIMVALSYIF